ncbi:MAG: pilus assembly protein [Tabrizicola sp.]|nr:pilus assembly protein [Tabrizicola sp.]
MTRFGRFLRDESGTASIEFVFMFPIVFTIFTASFEASLYMVRHVMFERAVDIVVRDIRLGLMDGVTHSGLKRRICETGMMVGSIQTCVDSMSIWMQPIDTSNFAMVAPPSSCVDKSQPISTEEPPGSSFAYGAANEIMLMRICWKEEPMFPTTAVSVRMPVNAADGNYALVVTSVFVNEPG